MEYLELYNKAKSALAEASSVDELSAIINQTDLIKHAAKLAKDNDMVQMATEIKLRAERRFGEVSRELEKATSNQYISAKSTPLTKQKTLESVGVSKQMANQFEKMAAIPDNDFEKALFDFKIESSLSRKKLLDTVYGRKEKPKSIKFDITPERDRPISFGSQAMTLLNIYRDIENINTVGEVLNFLQIEVNRLEKLAGWNLTKF